MSSHVRRLQANTRERILSTDFNNATALHHRALIEAASLVIRGDDAIYGVVSGFEVEVLAGLTINISPGLAMRLGTAATTYDSNTQWIELRATATLDLTGFVDGANPRWVAIEVSEASATEVSESRDVFNPATGTFTTSSLVKVTGSSPTISGRAGTAAASPIFPAGTAGVIPLAYVYLTAGAVSINATDIVFCRPMLRPDSAEPWAGVGGREVWGGGVAIDTAGTDMQLRNAGGRFDGHRTRWGISNVTGITDLTLVAAGMDGAALPGADAVIYLYAVPPPYPAGYDAELAPREFRPGATAVTRFSGGVAVGIFGALVIGSTVAPYVTSVQGNPAAGNFQITCPPFSSGAVNVDRTTAMYLGAVFRDFGTGDILVQNLRGSRVDYGHPGSVDLFASGIGQVSLWDSTINPISPWDNVLFPVTARTMHCLMSFFDSDPTSANPLTLRIDDVRVGDLASANLGHRFHPRPNSSAGSHDERFNYTFEVDSSGEITIDAISTQDASDDMAIFMLGYEDAILASR